MEKHRIHLLSKIIICTFPCVLFLLSCTNQSTPNQSEQKVDSLIKESRKILFTNIPLAKRMLKKAMEYTKDSMYYYNAYEAYSTTYLLENKYDSGIVMKNKVLLFLKKQPHTSQRQQLLSSINNAFGVYYSLMNQPDSAILYLNKSLSYSPRSESKPDIYINLADQYKAKGNLATAAYYLRLGLFTSDSLNMDELKFPLYYGLGDIYLELRDFNLANEYYLRAEADYKNRRFDEKVLFCNNRGNYYYYKKEYKNALLWFKRAEKHLRNTKYNYFRNLVFTNLSDVYLNLNKLDSCKYYLNQAEPYFKSINHKSALYYLNTIKMGLAIALKDYPLAYQIKKQIKGNKDINPDIISIRLKYLERLSLKKGNYKDAYTYLKQSAILNDSLRDDRTQKRIAELDIHYKQDSTLMKKDLIIQQQKAEVRTFKLSTCIWILISILILLGTVLGYHIIKKKTYIQKNKYIEQILKLKISNIRNRISPHFMFNVLCNEMQGLDNEKKNHLYTLAQLLRKSLEMAEQISISLKDEIEFAQAYIELSKHKIGNNFMMTWNIDQEIDAKHTQILPMMLQIPVENSIKHGLSTINRKKELTISIIKRSQGTQIYIIDNGIGYHPNAITTNSNTGTGLRVLRQSIQFLNSKNTHKIKVSIHNINDEKPNDIGTRVEIFIPDHFKFNYI